MSSITNKTFLKIKNNQAIEVTVPSPLFKFDNNFESNSIAV